MNTIEVLTQTLGYSYEEQVRSFLSASLNLTTLDPIGYDRCLSLLQHETYSNLLIVRPFAPSPLQRLPHYYGLG